MKVDELLFNYETDKASFEEHAKEEGTLLAIFFEADADVPVLATAGSSETPGRISAPWKPDSAEAAPAPAARQPAAPAPAASAPVVESPAPAAAALFHRRFPQGQGHSRPPGH